jgi:hypothetical protein
MARHQILINCQLQQKNLSSEHSSHLIWVQLVLAVVQKLPLLGKYFKPIIKKCLKLSLVNHRPGSYEFDVKRNRSVAMAYSFGGESRLIPAVQVKCGVNKNEKVIECIFKPEVIVDKVLLF